MLVEVRADGQRRFTLHVGGAVDQVRERVDVLAGARRTDQPRVAVLVVRTFISLSGSAKLVACPPASFSLSLVSTTCERRR
ncbi:MAG: hypothetical protein MUD07_11640 [Burkholderiaceae bacterium]|nr:hypothetical protein [Burkholderiaceae bacterium]